IVRRDLGPLFLGRATSELSSSDPVSRPCTQTGLGAACTPRSAELLTSAPFCFPLKLDKGEVNMSSYKVVREIGHGGFGVVEEVINARGERLARKTFRP